MAWMRTNPAVGGFLLVLTLTAGGCQLSGGFATTQPVVWGAPQPAGPQPAPAAAPNGAAQPSPTGGLAPEPPVASVQRDVEEFVNRFPDSDIARQRSRQAPPAAQPADAHAAITIKPEPASGQVPTPAQERPSTSLNAATPVAAPVPVTTPTEPPAPLPANVVRVSSPAGPESPAPPPAVDAAGAAQPASPVPPAVPSAGTPAEPAGIRANAPLAASRIERPVVAPEAVPSAPKIEALEISPIRPAAPAEPAPPKAEPNRAATVAPTVKVRDIDATIAELQKSVAERPNDFNAHFRLRMLYLAESQDDKATAPINGLDPELSESFLDVTRTLVAVRDAVRDPIGRGASALQQARQLVQRLRRQAPVAIDRIAVVSRVNSYGDYEEFAPAEFPAGRATNVILYVEVSNFRSEPEKAENGREQYRTLLGEKVEIYDARGVSVFKQAQDRIPDTCRRPRNDFFLALELPLPETLAPGTYTIKATVEDKLGATADQSQTTFTITAPAQAQTASIRR